MKKVFGIISYIPDKEPDRTQRINRLERLLKQLFDFWPDIPVMFISQNWKTYVPKTKSKSIIYSYGKLGIIGARNTLREKFLESEFDYLIMYDDDAIIECEDKDAPQKYVEAIDGHPYGFMFLQYQSSQLNGCAISRYIYDKEPMVNIDAQNSEAFEDSIYSSLLHNKYPDREFIFTGIKCTHFRNPAENAPSTWASDGKKDWHKLRANTATILNYIVEHKELPNLDIFFDRELDVDGNCYMQLSGNCTGLGYLGKDRIRGPIDNVVTNGVECMKLLINNEYYNKVVSVEPKTFNRKANFVGDNTVGYEYSFVQIVHGDPKSTEYKLELKKRCNNFNTFYEKLKQSNNYYFTMNLYNYEVDSVTHELNGKVLEEELEYLKSLNLLSRLIIVGTRQRDRKDTANWWSDKATSLISKYGVKYIEIVDNDLSNVDASHSQFIHNIKNGKTIPVQKIPTVNVNTVDIVITYVDSEDAEWQKIYKEFSGEETNPEANGVQRFRTNHDFVYLFRGIQKYLPWINQVFLVVQNDGQVPAWINRDSVKIILHKDIIPEEFLPVFNSQAIEMFLGNIPGLSERFIYANDDTYIVGDMRPGDFFEDNKVRTSFAPTNIGDRNKMPLWKQAILNSGLLTNKKETEYLMQNGNRCVTPTHVIRPYLLSKMQEVNSLYSMEIYNSISRFRAPNNLTVYVYDLYLKSKGLIADRKYNAAYFSSQSSVGLIANSLVNPDSIKIVCINDTADVVDKNRDRLITEQFKYKFPVKSKYEK